jgi:hypothetical protein
MGRGRKPDEWYKSEECERVVKLAKEGYSEGRIAEIVGIKKSRVMYAKRLFGIKGVRKFTTSGITYNDSLLAKHEHSNSGNEKRKQESESQLAFLLLDKGFFYVGGYDGLHGKSDVKLSCLVCGGTFTRHDCVSLFKANQIQCPYCTAKVKEQEEQEREEKRRTKEERQLNLKLEAEREEQEKLNAEQVCKWCGKTFTLAEYREREHTNHCQFTAYCSSDCREKGNRQALREWNKEHKYNARHKKRAIKYGCEYENGVTLKKLIKRDGLRCAICGGMCDLNDRSYGNGNGPLYPSIDHIKPMSKQGGHTWDNVQIAHIICNARKSAKTEEKYGNAL